MEVKSIEGLKFGRLRALDKYFRKNKHTYWLCKCECGNEKYIRKNELVRGKIRSCGCNHYTHITENRKLIKVLVGMKQRCYNPNVPYYKNYGGRGIKICEEWLNDSKKFYEWAENNGYKEGLTIDRINVDGDYEPTNCRWATYKEQNNNKRKDLIKYKVLELR